MAKKKRRRSRRPVAPPVHSAPDTVHGPAGPRPSDAPPSRPVTPEPPPGTSDVAGYSPPPTRTREADRRRPQRRRKKSRARTYLIVAGIVVLIAGALFVRQMLNSRRTNEFEALAKRAGCSEIRETGGSGSAQHLAPGASTRYDTSPPTHGAHDGQGVVQNGVYDEPFSEDPDQQPSIYRAVHSLEHGYIIVWQEGLTREQERELERKYRDEHKVIVVPYPKLRGDTKVALTAWGRMVTCERPDTRVIDSFIELFREARSAPEPKAP